jgi:hypothetical protein
MSGVKERACGPCASSRFCLHLSTTSSNFNSTVADLGIMTSNDFELTGVEVYSLLPLQLTIHTVAPPDICDAPTVPPRPLEGAWRLPT